MESTFFTDLRDGKVYKTVKIGEQVWMAQNLNYEAEGSVCYNNDPANGEKYGRLYNWETAKKNCPSGWHLPSKEEWQILFDFAGGNEIAGKKLKATGGWGYDSKGNSGDGTDEFGFAALPGGYGYPDGDFGAVDYYSYWWSASEDEEVADYAYYRYVFFYEYADLEFDYKSQLLSVRCLQD